VTPFASARCTPLSATRTFRAKCRLSGSQTTYLIADAAVIRVALRGLPLPRSSGSSRPQSRRGDGSTVALLAVSQSAWAQAYRMVMALFQKVTEIASPEMKEVAGTRASRIWLPQGRATGKLLTLRAYGLPWPDAGPSTVARRAPPRLYCACACGGNFFCGDGAAAVSESWPPPLLLSPSPATAQRSRAQYPRGSCCSCRY